MMRKSKVIEIFGEQAPLTERDAYDVMILANAKINGNTTSRTIFELGKVLEAGLKYAPRSLKWYRALKKLSWKRKFRLSYLIKHLSINTELPLLAGEVYKLEGIDIDKLIDEEKKKIVQNSDTTIPSQLI